MWYRVKYSQPTTSPPAGATRLTHKTVPAYPLLPSFSANCLKQKGSTTKLFCDAMLMFLLNWWFLEFWETNADRDRRCDAFVDWRLMSSGRYFLMLVSAQWRNWERRRRREKREKGGGEELFVFPPSPLLSSLLARQPSSTHIGARVRHKWQQRDRKRFERLQNEALISYPTLSVSAATVEAGGCGCWINYVVRSDRAGLMCMRCCFPCANCSVSLLIDGGRFRYFLLVLG